MRTSFDWSARRRWSAGAVALALLATTGIASAQTFSITRAEWSSSDGGRLRVEGTGTEDRTVTIRNAGNNVVLGTDTVEEDGEWSRSVSSLSQVPCTVSAQQSGSTTVLTRDVTNRPSNCGPVAGATPSISINDVTVTEGGTANFTVTLSATPTAQVTVNFATAIGSTQGASDFAARTGSLTFAAGTTTRTQTIAITTVNDNLGEATEAFNVNLSGATNATIADAQGVGTINDNDQVTQPSISINDVTVTEGSTANFTLSLSAASTQQVTVVASTVNGTATAGSDYTARTTVTVTFPAGSTTQTFTVTTLPDTATEGAETFNVNLASAANATIADAQGVGSILNTAQGPTISINDVSVTEGQAASFTVTLSATPTSTVTVTYATADGSATTAGNDYTARTATTLTFAAGTTALSQTVSVTTRQDTVAEPTETFNLNLSGATNATLADARGVGTIVDDDFTDPTQAHATMTTYAGPQTCIACHETDARRIHGSVHYQQNAVAPNVTNINPVGTPTANLRLAGEGPADRVPPVNALIGINTYCGTHQSSPRFTCAGCHVGNGRFPKTPTELAALSATAQLQELANIDCLMCHQQAYKRFPDWVPLVDGGEGLGFDSLVLENVREVTNPVTNRPELVASPGSTVTRTGLAGIPIVGTSRDFRFRPAGAAGSEFPLPADAPSMPGFPMALTTEQAAQQVHRTTRQSCLNCHAGAAGANGAKRGDLSTANVNSTDLNLDRHMATTGSNMTCSSCHNVNDTAGNSLHRVRGRGLDLRANDVTARFTCDNAGCHDATTVHSAVTNGTQIARHMTKVACQTCHIPTYGKGVATEIARNWQSPTLSPTACNGRGGWLPAETKSSEATPPVGVVPTYQWFDGTSQVYYLTEPLTNTPRKPLTAAAATALNMPATTQAYVMGRPNPNPDNATTRITGASNNASKIYPMKEHWGKLARNTANNTLIPQSTYEFFRTGSFCRAVALGLNPTATDAQLDQQCPNQTSPPPAGTEVVAVHTYQTINHGVEPQANALGANNTCGTCHDVPISPFTTGKPLRMNLQRDMGYAVTRAGLTETSPGNWSCSPSCHGNKTGNFTNIHSRSQHRSAGCNACHGQITGR